MLRLQNFHSLCCFLATIDKHLSRCSHDSLCCYRYPQPPKGENFWYYKPYQIFSLLSYPVTCRKLTNTKCSFQRWIWGFSFNTHFCTEVLWIGTRYKIEKAKKEKRIQVFEMLQHYIHTSELIFYFWTQMNNSYIWFCKIYNE